MTVSVIITNYNGLKTLQNSLPAILDNSPEAHEFVFIDDASTDGSASYVRSLQKKYSKLRLLVQKQNRGFAHSSNRAVKAAKGELVVLLNNDIYPQKGYITAALKHFKDPSVFGVGFAEQGHANYPRFFWKDGYLQYEPIYDPPQTHITSWLSGGSSIVRREIFQKLGGFDEIYAPFYSEDLDLGYRAWKSGYTLLWEPKAVVTHNHGTTISKFPKRFLDYVKERNRLLTVWRNITDPSLLRSNRLALVSRCLFGPNYIKIIRAASRQVDTFPSPTVFPRLTDQQILNLFKS